MARTPSGAVPDTEGIVAWLAPLLAQHGSDACPAVRRLCQPGALPEAQHAALRTALASLLTDPVHETLADQAAELLGGSALLDRIAVLLARLDQHPAPTLAPPRHLSGRQQQRHHRHGPSPGQCSSDAARVLRLIGGLEKALATAGPALPEAIGDWLVRFPHLGTSAPEVVGALLSVLRQCPDAQTAIQTILGHVPLSQRQRQALEAAVHIPLSAPTTPPDPMAWVPLVPGPAGPSQSC